MNSKVTMVLRIILGLALLVFGLNKFLWFLPQPESLPEGAANFMGALTGTGYMIKLIGTVEVVSGLLLLINKWVPFALVLLAPVVVNIIFYHLKFDPATIGPGALIAIIEIILIYTNWDKLKSLFK